MMILLLRNPWYALALLSSWSGRVEIAEHFWLDVAGLLPRGLRRAVLVRTAAEATSPPHIAPDDYAGPDDLDYERLYAVVR